MAETDVPDVPGSQLWAAGRDEWVADALVSADDERAWRDGVGLDDAMARALAYSDEVGLSDGTDRPAREVAEL